MPSAWPKTGIRDASWTKAKSATFLKEELQQLHMHSWHLWEDWVNHWSFLCVSLLQIDSTAVALSWYHIEFEYSGQVICCFAKCTQQKKCTSTGSTRQIKYNKVMVKSDQGWISQAKKTKAPESSSKSNIEQNLYSQAQSGNIDKKMASFMHGHQIRAWGRPSFQTNKLFWNLQCDATSSVPVNVTILEDLFLLGPLGCRTIALVHCRTQQQHTKTMKGLTEELPWLLCCRKWLNIWEVSRTYWKAPSNSWLMGVPIVDLEFMIKTARLTWCWKRSPVWWILRFWPCHMRTPDT